MQDSPIYNFLQKFTPDALSNLLFYKKLDNNNLIEHIIDDKELFQILKLPDELILEVLSHLDIKNITQARLACKKLLTISNNYKVNATSTLQNNNNNINTINNPEKFSEFLIRRKNEKERTQTQANILKKLNKVENESEYVEAHKEVNEAIEGGKLDERGKNILVANLNNSRQKVIKGQDSCNIISSGMTYAWNTALTVITAIIGGIWFGIGYYYPKSTFQITGSCEGNFTYENVTICQDHIEAFLTGTSAAWYMTGMVGGFLLQMLDRYTHDKLTKKKPYLNFYQPSMTNLLLKQK